MKSKGFLGWFSMTLILIAYLALFTAAGSAQTPKAMSFRIASADIGSGWYIYGAAIGELIKKEIPGSTYDVLPTAATIANIKMLEKGDAELGLSLSNADRWAKEGIISFTEKTKNIAGFVGSMDNYYLGIIINKKTGITSLEQIKEKKFPLKLLTVPVGGAGELGTRQLLEAYGMSYQDLKSWGGSVSHVGRSAIEGAIKDGQADAVIHTINVGHPMASAIAIGTDVRFLPVRDDVIKALCDKYGYTALTIPSDAFKGQNYPVKTIGSHTTLLGLKNLPIEVAYKVTKAVCENKDALGKAHAGLKEFQPEVSWRPDKIGMDLHPGSVKFYKEKGWMK
jgi:TRAP transporter TAXI family solute receptor